MRKSFVLTARPSLTGLTTFEQPNTLGGHQKLPEQIIKKSTRRCRNPSSSQGSGKRFESRENPTGRSTRHTLIAGTAERNATSITMTVTCASSDILRVTTSRKRSHVYCNCIWLYGQIAMGFAANLYKVLHRQLINCVPYQPGRCPLQLGATRHIPQPG